MFNSATGLVLGIVQHGLIWLIFFVAFASVIFILFTKPKSAVAFRSLWRLLWTAISTPFVFVRSAFNIVGGAADAERDYEGTREFVLFRYSRIQYLIVCILSVIYLGTLGVTALFLLYPGEQIAQSNALKQQLDTLNADLATTQTNIADSSRPDFTALSASKLIKAREAYLKQFQDDQAFQTTVSFTGPIRGQIAGASDVATLNNLKAQLDTYFIDCPTGPTWTGYTSEQCQQYKSFALASIDRKIAEVTLLAAYNDANNAVNNTAVAIAGYQSHLTDVRAQIATTQSQYNDASVWNGKWIGSHLSSAIFTGLRGIVLFILSIWIFAMIIDVINWLIMMMRSLERRHATGKVPVE